MNIISLLQRISSTQIEDMIFEESLRMKGYQFFNALDNNEIHRYCFPMNLDGQGYDRDSAGDVNIDLETDIITAYDEFFQTISNSNPAFFLDEYVLELEGLKTQIQARINKSELFNYAQNFNDYLENLAKKGNIIEDFTLFIAIATGILKNGAQRFNSVVLNPCFLVSFDQLESIPNKVIFTEVFQNNSKLNPLLVDEIFDKFVDQKRIINRLSKRIDSEAIARLILINDDLERRNQRKLFLFLSTSSASAEVFKKIGRSLPKIDGHAFNFHRTVDQLFLNRLLNDLQGEEKIERLRKVQELVTTRENVDNYEKEQAANFPEYIALEKNLEQSFKVVREKYVNTNLARKEQFEKIEKLYGDLEKAKTKMSKRRLEELFKLLKKMALEYEDEQTNLKELRVVESTFHIGQIFLASFKKAIFLLKTGQNLKVSRGKDKIAGRGQHLPIVFTPSDHVANNVLDEIAQLYLNQFAFARNAAPNQVLINHLSNLAADASSTEFSGSSIENKLVFCLYSLLLPDVNHQRSNSELVEDFLKALVPLESGNDLALFSDAIYILCWVCRRNRNYSMAQKYTQLGLENFPLDPRFYHSRFLIDACLEDGLESKEELIKTYTGQIMDIQRARELYVTVLKRKEEVIRHNTITTLLNSELFVNLLLIEKSGLSPADKKQKLATLRTYYLQELKIVCGDTYNEYPEFQHTEVLLEKLEIELETDHARKKEKLDFAIKTISDAIRTASDLDGFSTIAYHELLTELKQESLLLAPERSLSSQT